MIEVGIALAGLIGGFLIALGWYRRGILEMEKDLSGLKDRIDTLEVDGQITKTDLAVIKQRIGFMEEKINDIHGVIMRTAKLGGAE